MDYSQDLSFSDMTSGDEFPMTEIQQPTQQQVFRRAQAALRNKADNSIRELIAFDEISAYVNANSGDAIARWIEKNIPLLDSGARDDFEHSLDEMIKALHKTKEVVRKNGYATVELTPEIPRRDADAAFTRFMLIAGLELADRSAITGRAFLMAAESSFEVLFGQLARVIYAKNPGALPKSEHSFTLEEMSTYGSIEEARDALVDRKIEALLRESPDEWAKWLKRTIGMSMEEVMSDWPQTREIFTRRNMLVHTDGNVTERYLAEVKRSGGSIDGIKVGDSLIPSSDYMQNALQRLIAFETLLVCKIVSHIDKQGADGIAAWLAGNLDLAVHTERWEAACLVADSFSGVKCKRNTELKVLISGWLAHKNRDGVDHIKQEVSAWDVSGLHEDYRTTKKILLDQLTADELPKLLTSGRFTRFEVLTDPLFSNVRDLIPPLSSS
jgi:hypothetical protein